MPDWGSPAQGSPSLGPPLDDEALALQLQRQLNKEVDGPGGVNTLDDDSLAVARQLQVSFAFSFPVSFAAIIFIVLLDDSKLHTSTWVSSDYVPLLYMPCRHLSSLFFPIWNIVDAWAPAVGNCCVQSADNVHALCSPVTEHLAFC